MKGTLKPIDAFQSIASFAGQVLYPYNPQNNSFLSFSHLMYTKFCLSQIHSYFTDFQAREFPDLSIKIYAEICSAVKKNNRTELLHHMTPPNVEIFKMCSKSSKKPPFELYEKINSSKLVHARFSSDSDENSATVNFAHITMKMEGVNEKGETKVQFNTFERRLDNKFKEAWRICFIDEV